MPKHIKPPLEGKGYQKILDVMLDKACTKQAIYRVTRDKFALFKKEIRELAGRLHQDVGAKDTSVEIFYKEHGDFETELRFGSDVLFFSMHTNVFAFPDEHEVNQTDYVAQDPWRGYCGMILVYNFLADTVRYNRIKDEGYLMARIFINKEGHFFVEGQRRLGFLYNEFEKSVLEPVFVQAIIAASVEFALDFDLQSRPYEDIKTISWEDKQQIALSAGQRTGKRLGFQFYKEGGVF